MYCKDENCIKYYVKYYQLRKEKSNIAIFAHHILPRIFKAYICIISFYVKNFLCQTHFPYTRYMRLFFKIDKYTAVKSFLHNINSFAIMLITFLQNVLILYEKKVVRKGVNFPWQLYNVLRCTI